MPSVIDSTDIKESYIADFESLSGLYLDRNSYLYPVRKEAIEAFASLGFPTTRHEEWKYTRVKQVVNQAYKIQTPAQPFRLSAEDIGPFLLSSRNGIDRIVIENGIYNKDLSSVSPDGFIVCGSLSDNMDHPLVKEHLARYADFRNEAFVALNTAFAADGAVVIIPDNTVLKRPVHILYIADSRAGKYLSYPRTLCVAGRNSQAQIVESFHSFNEFSSFTNVVTEVVAGENAYVDLYKIQDENAKASQINFTQVDQEAGSNCSVHTITLSGGFIRNNLNYLLNGSNCETHMYGLYLLSGEQLVDNHTFVDHARPHCYSNELYKGVISDRSTAVFNGKIMVRQDAQKTNAYQSNSNMLLSDSANIFTKPQLEIFADDVKCSHGATTGQLDTEAMFYMRARGISEEKARAMLLTAFANDVLSTVKIDSLRENLIKRVAERFRQE
jgi:Fe-S cluster assembly protein SufD